jgi:8-oxo-dGTP pyrophosphatase MutT (NUDIX family)
MKNIYSAGIVAYFKTGDTIEYLLLHYLGGHWDFPKGKLEAGETKEQAALRELEEETSLSVSIDPGFDISYSYTFKDKNKQMIAKTVYFYTGQTNSKDVIISHEHQGYMWLDYEQSLYKLTYENAKGILAKADCFLRQYHNI